MSTYETGVYAIGNFPCYRANGLDTIRTAIHSIAGVLGAAGWAQTGLVKAQGYFSIPIGAPVLSGSTGPAAPQYYCGICD